MSTTERPIEGQYLPYYDTYIRHIPAGAAPLYMLEKLPDALHQAVGQLTDEQARFAYAPGKWTIKEVLVHVIDTERIFAYRALRMARNDKTDLPGFEQDDYVPASEANERTMSSILEEYAAVRAATIALFRSFSETQLARTGSANGGPASVRALLFIIPGHELHHLSILRERYFPAMS
ncbi:DinB family protein [Hymenobacter chitinivorans]|uniref:DinB family protein n=1 Tax=Hymenobacter chitinivorans DSM 11115 TaxID=1121954 RepID=A0A2M9BRW4_9BACT|nr:DinB family protein [Hymenobacter chitinivorans]PJJ60671.1 DinB family protein [Hymenobacter chitinivorans DSM 11115]